LPKKLRSVLQLSVVEEMEAADVGAVLGIPAGTVRVAVCHTARKLLLDVDEMKNACKNGKIRCGKRR